MGRAEFVVVGQIARDLVLSVPGVPEPGGTVAVTERRELLGGKGANQAVTLAQLGAAVALVGVVGDDAVGEWLCRQAGADGIDTRAVVRRSGAESGLVVDVLAGEDPFRYLEDLPLPVRVSPADVEAAAALLAGARAVLLELQQPAGSLERAATLGRRAGALVVADGNPPDDALLRLVDVARLDAREASLLLGDDVNDGRAALAAARSVRARGPRIAAVAAGPAGNALCYEGGEVLLPLIDGTVRDTTGAGDAFSAVLTLELARGRSPLEAGRSATAAAGHVVGRPGGRPAISSGILAGWRVALAAREGGT